MLSINGIQAFLLMPLDSTCTCDTHKRDYIVYTCPHLFELNVHLQDLGLSFMATKYESRFVASHSTTVN